MVAAVATPWMLSPDRKPIHEVTTQQRGAWFGEFAAVVVIETFGNDVHGDLGHLFVTLTVTGTAIGAGGPIQDHVAKFLRYLIAQVDEVFEYLGTKGDDDIRLMFFIPAMHGLEFGSFKE